MVRQDIVGYIKQNRAKGYSDDQLRQWLLQNRLPPQEVDNAFNAVTEKKPFPTKLVIIIAAAVILIGGGVSAVLFLGGATCGNGIVEKGEFPSTCCLDAGCTNGLTCEDNECVVTACGACEYEENGTCVEEACCNDADCDDGEPGTADSCTGVPKRCFNEPIMECLNDDGHCPDACTFQTDNDCEQEDLCVEDSECDDDIAATLDMCMGTPKRCENVYTLLCTDDDGYCPDGCDHTTDTDCSAVDECVDDHDCVDNNVSTKDECSGTPKTCKNTPITLCIDNDEYCPPLCTFLTDEDCPEEDLCETDDECEDEDISTSNNCTGEPKRCVFTKITECVHNDNYCPSGCTFDEDHDCENDHECLIDEECDDDDPSTLDACDGNPKTCSNTPITGCADDDGYCPQMCVYVEDNDCEELYDLSLISPITIVDATTHEQLPICGHSSAAAFNITSTFPGAVTVRFVDFKDEVRGTRLEKSIPSGTSTVHHFLGEAENNFELRMIVNVEEVRDHTSDPAIVPENTYDDNELSESIGVACIS